MRFIITFLPYLCILSAYGIFKLYSLLKIKAGKKTAFFIFSAIFLVASVQVFPQLFVRQEKEIQDVFQSYVARQDVQGGIWISNPRFMLHSDKQTAELIYYPLFGSEKIDNLISRLKTAKHILIDDCDLPCPPWEEKCPEKRQAFFSVIETDFKKVYEEKRPGCPYYIYSR